MKAPGIVALLAVQSDIEGEGTKVSVRRGGIDAEHLSIRHSSEGSCIGFDKSGVINNLGVNAPGTMSLKAL